MAESSSSMSTDGNVMNPAWDIFSPEAMDLSTVEREYVEYREQNVTNTKGLTKYEIETRDKDSFIEPHMGFLEVKYRLTTDQAGTTAIPLSDKIALQNHGLSLFKNCEYLIEDQRIEYTDDPAIAYTIKNVSDFSRQYGDSIASSEGFYLDTNDHATLKNCNLRFFNNSAGRYGVELFFNQFISGVPATTIRVSTAASVTTWQNTDSVVALIDSNFPTPSAAAGGVGAGAALPANYPNKVIFNVSAPATIGVYTVVTLTLNATGDLVPSAGAAADLVTAWRNDTLEPVRFFRSSLTGAYPDAPDLGVSVPLIAGPLLSLAGGASGDNFIGGTVNPNDYNQGFQKRYLQAIRSASTINSPTGQYHSLWIPLKNMFMFCRAYDKISRGLRHRIVLNRNPDNLALLRHGSTPNRYFSLEYVSCWIPRLKPSGQVLKEIEGKLVSGANYTINFTDLTCWHTNLVLSSAGTQAAYQLATTTKKPIRVWIAFQLQNRYEGDQISNKRVFDHLNTTAIQVRLNQQLFPLYEYKFDKNQTTNYLSTGTVTGVNEMLNYQRAYNALLSAAYKNRDSMDGSMITYEQFESVYPIYYFDLTCQPEELYKAAKYAELELRWTNQSAQNYYAWVVYESERNLAFKGVNGSFALVM